MVRSLLQSCAHVRWEKPCLEIIPVDLANGLFLGKTKHGQPQKLHIAPESNMIYGLVFPCLFHLNHDSPRLTMTPHNSP
jgi:hypothetical protein